jgi:hypothetical protein
MVFNAQMNQLSITEKLRIELEDAWKSFMDGENSALGIEFEPFGVSAGELTVRQQERNLSDSTLRKLIQKLGDRGQYSCSHTHTSDGIWSVAAGAANGTLSVGIDFESVYRKVPHGLGKRISRNVQTIAPLQPIEIWVIKEAAFKAYPLNSGTVLSHYEITEWDPESRAGLITINQSQIPVALLHSGPFVVGFAKCFTVSTKSPSARI